MSQSTIIEIAREESIVALHNFDLVGYALESFEDLLSFRRQLYGHLKMLSFDR